MGFGNLKLCANQRVTGRPLLASAVAALSLVASQQNASAAAVYAWNVASGSASWNANTSWTPNTGFPNAAGDTANINTKNITAAVTITLAAPVTVGTINIGDTDFGSSYTVSCSTITLNNSGGGASINQALQSKGDTISSALTLADNTTFTNAAAANLTVSGAVGGTGNVVTQANSTKDINLNGAMNFAGSLTNSGTGTGGSLVTGTLNSGITSITQSSGTSALTVNGANGGFAGNVLISTGTLKVGTSTLGTSNAVTIGNSGTLDIGNGAATVAGLNNVTSATTGNVTSGTKVLTIGGSGTYSYSGGFTTTAVTVALGSGGSQAFSSTTNSNTSATSLSSGTLLLNGSNALGSSTGVLNVTGASTFDTSTTGGQTLNNNKLVQSANFTFGGTNSLNFGSTAILSLAAGTLTSNLNGTGKTLTFGGGIVNNFGGLVTDTVNGAGNTLSVGGINLGTKQITLNGTANLLVTGALSNGAGALQLNMTTTTLQAAAATGGTAFTGPTTVGGTVYANNTSGSATGTGSVTINTGGTLGGTGSIAGTVAGAVGGTGSIAAGVANIGSLTTGGADFSAGLTDVVELGTPGTNDMLTVTGIAANSLKLNGSSKLSLVDNANANGQGSVAAGVYHIIATVSGARGGTFATGGTNTFGSGASTLHANTTYTATSVDVTAYRLATASLTPTSVNLGIIHPGGTFGTSSVAIGNTAATDGFSEKLTATASANGANASFSGSPATINPGASSNLTVGLANANTSTVGSKNDSLNVLLQSNGAGTSGFGLTNLNGTGSAVQIAGQVNDFAQHDIAKTSGTGVLTGSGTSYTLDFGTVGASDSASLSLTNTVLSSALYQDILNGTFDTSGAGAFTFSGSTGIAAGNANALTVAFSGLSSGTYNGTILLNGISSNASGNTAETPVTLNLLATVSVPEPHSVALLSAGLFGFTARRRRQVARRDSVG